MKSIELLKQMLEIAEAEPEQYEQELTNMFNDSTLAFKDSEGQVGLFVDNTFMSPEGETITLQNIESYRVGIFE